MTRALQPRACAAAACAAALLAAAACAAALLAACGVGRSQLGAGPSWRQASEAPGRGRVRSADGALVALAPSRPGAKAYNADEPIEVAISPLERAIVRAFADAAAAKGRPAPASDLRLFAAAEDLAVIATHDTSVPYALAEFAMRHYGLVEPLPHMLLVWGPSEDQDVILAKLQERLPSLLDQTRVARIGAAVVERGDSDVILILLQQSFVELEPVPRELRGDDSFELRARILPPYRDPEVFVTGQDGAVSSRVASVEGGRLRANVSCKGRTGPQQIEITALDASGSQVLANFPVWCNAAAPRRSEVRVEAASERVATEADADARMLALINRDRAAAGLPPLARAAGLARVAAAHSAEMRETGVVAHVSPRTGSAADRVRAAGIRTAVVMENVARAYGVQEAQEGLMNSPGHRANILAPDVTHVGVGILFGAGEAGLRELFVTQVFMRVPPLLAPGAGSAELLARIKAERAMTEDARLSSIAQTFAEAVASGTSSADASRRASAQLDELSSSFARVTTVVNAVASVGSFPVDRIVREQASRLGIGVAQGPHAVIGERAIYVVVLIAAPR